MSDSNERLSLGEVLFMYARLMAATGGLAGIRDINMLQSALALPWQTFDGQPLYPTLVEKAAVLGYAIVQNHPFIDGNKRIAHLAMETLLARNGFLIAASVDEQEQMMLTLASGEMSLQELTLWLEQHLQPIESENLP